MTMSINYCDVTSPCAYQLQLLSASTNCTSHRHLQVLACRTASVGPRSLAIAACAPKLWNSLPPSLRDPTLTLTLFCSRLKTHLFGLTYGHVLVTVLELRGGLGGPGPLSSSWKICNFC